MISYKFKLYNTKRNKHLELLFQEACFVWNRFLAIQKRYYKLFGKYASANKLQKHFAKRYKRTYLHSQSAQEIIQRLDAAYQRFFKHLAKRPPKFKRKYKFTSVAYKQGGYSIQGNAITLNALQKTFKFHLSRKIQGSVKRLCIKRSSYGEYYLVVTTDHTQHNTYTKTHDGASVGIDFGLKTYLTLSDGQKVKHPQYFKKYLKQIQRADRLFSMKKLGSNNRKQAKRTMCRLEEKVVHSRTDFQWKLAHDLCKRYDYIFLEDLSLEGMCRLWGRKMRDLAHGKFVSILEQVAPKYNCVVHKIERFYPSSKLCDCGYVNKDLKLYERQWECPHCGHVHDRDIHAAQNILRRGIYELESECKTTVGITH